MLRNGRGIDSGFKPRHLLFHRCKKDDVKAGRLLPDAISYKNTSCNWSKYCWPWDVIFEHPGQGIAMFFVRHLPTNLPTHRDEFMKEYSYKPAHDPLEDNYSHTEIRTFKEGVEMPKPKPSEEAKKEFRTIMSNMSFIVLDPAI